MRLVLQGLERLRWPPSLVAFSDPLDSLVNDNDTFYNAIEYILEVGISKSSSIRLRIKEKQKEEEENAKKYDNHDIDDSNVDTTKIYDDISFASNSSQSTTIHNKKTDDKIKKSNNFNTKSLSTSKFSKTSIPGLGIEVIDSHTKHNNLNDISIISSRSDANSDIFNYDDSRPGSSSSNYSKVSRRSTASTAMSSAPMTRPKDYASLLQAFEVLQHQNEILSKELKRIHIINNAKVATEDRLTSLLLDLKMSIDDIVSVSGDKTSTKPTMKIDSDVTQGIFSTGMKIDGSLEKVSDTKGTSKRVPMVTQPKHDQNSSIIWNKLQSRINDIKKQWEDAISESRKQSSAGFTVHDKTSQFVDINGNSSSKRISPNKSHAVPSSARSTMSNRTTASADTFFTNSRNPTNIPIKFNDVLGIKPPLSSIELNSGIMGDSMTQNLMFDLPRIHLLQRDLIGFAEEAFTVLEMNNNDTSSGKPSIFSRANTSTDDSIHSDDLEALRLKAQSLLIHLSSIAPIAPLTADFPMSSSMSGLDSLINEAIYLQQISKSNRASSLTLQKAADRAKAEHVAILRCLHQSQTCLKTLPKMVKNISPILENITTKTTKIFKKAMDEVTQIIENIKTLSTSYYDAEKSRIKQGTSTVNPLDSLTRGVMGDATASLIHAIRLNIDGIKNLTVALESLQKKVISEYNGELEKLHCAKDDLLKFESSTSKVINNEIRASNTNSISSNSLYTSYKNTDKKPSFLL